MEDSGKTVEQLCAECDELRRRLAVVDAQTMGDFSRHEAILAGGHPGQRRPANDGRDAIKLFEQHHADIVILDLTMPHMNGEEAFRKLKGIKPDVKVLLSSGYNEQDIINRFSGKGLAGFIHKPYKYKKLQSQIQQVIENSNNGF